MDGLAGLAGLVCVTALVGLLVLVYKLASRPRGAEIESVRRALGDLSHRVHALERKLAARGDGEAAAAKPAPPDAVAARPAEPSPSPMVVAPIAAAPAAAKSGWIETRPAAPDEPPPLPPPLPPAEAVLPPQPAAQAPPPPTVEEPVAAVAKRPEVSLESFLGGRVMLIVGVIVALIGVAFFLKYAIDQGWIGPGTRIAMGVVTGVALLVGGDRMRPRGYDVFGQALMGCGLGALYLSNYFACSIYDLINPTAAFALTAAITAAGASLALWRGAPVLAYLGFLGGYLAPWLLSRKTGDLAGLTIWLGVLDAGLLVVLLRRAWDGLDLLALVATSVYVSVWFASHAQGRELGLACGCLAALLAASLALGLAPSIVRRAAPAGLSLVGVAAAGALSVVAGHRLLFPAHRWELGAGVVALGAAYLVASRLIASRVEGARAESEGLLGFAAAALATALAVVASGTAVPPTLSAAGVALVYAGARMRHGVLLACGIGSIGLAFGDLLLHRLGMFDAAATPLLNERFFVFACPCAALLVAGRLVSKVENLPPLAATLVGAAGLLVLPLVLAADVYGAIRPTDAFHRELRYVAPAAALAVYAFLSARLFGRGSATGRVFAFVPVVFALVFGVTLFFSGHVRPFDVVANPTFAAGMLVVAAAASAAGSAETGARDLFRIVAVLYLLALLTAEVHAWGETCSLGTHGVRAEARFVARNWTAVAWAAFAAALTLMEAARRWRPLACLSTGDAAHERALALVPLAGAFAIEIAIQVDRSHVPDWAHGPVAGAPLTPFLNLVFAGGLAFVAAGHVVGRAPFGAARRIVRIAALACLLALVTAEIHWWRDWRIWNLRDGASRTVAELDATAWTTTAWALFAAAFAWMGAARRLPLLRWVGTDDETLESRLAFVPLAGAVLWGFAVLLGGRGGPFTIFVNLPFAAYAAVAAAAFAVGERSGGGARGAARIGALVWLLLAVTAEIHAWGRTCPVGDGTRAEAEFRAIVWISIAWAAYAASLVAIGFMRSNAPLRWMGLAVFALTLAKVFLLDMAQLEAVYRIGSFLVLGAFLVAASFLYQRARRGEDTPT